MSKIIKLNELINNQACFLEVVKKLKSGGILAIPTDTVYGFAVDCESKIAVERLYEIKGRDKGKPLILFISSIEQLFTFSIFPSPQIMKLLRKYWPGKLTGVFLNASIKLKNFNYPTVGIRIPCQPELQNFLSRYPGFFFTTSANRSGKPVCTTSEEIEREFGNEIDYIFTSDIPTENEPSTVVDFSVDPPEILRKGKIIPDFVSGQ
ncbi:MAG: threonylcarbamoyl-AMP synthase [Candidatus Riflebacteria bacterium]|nr:threonylcarbamoyl-AMP synthase [Candidatus Riflebacteria bacterium]